MYFYSLDVSALKSVQIIVPKDKSKLVITVLNNLKLPYTKIDGEKEDVFILVLRDETVELLTQAVKKIGVGTVYGSIQLVPLEFAASSTIPEEKARLPRASREEILADITGKAQLNASYMTYTVTSSIIAALGLLTNNIVMIIASMLIAPLIGPILGVSLGTTLGINDLQRESLKAETIGIILAIVIGVIVTAFTPYTTITEQIAIRAHPMYTDILFAMVAGLAAALSIASVETMSLIGVAIAASILPPAINVGIGLAFYIKGVPGSEVIVFGSLTLLTINILAINFMSLAFFWFTGITTTLSARKKFVTKKSLIKSSFLVLILLAIASYPIIISTNNHFIEVSVENKIRTAVLEYINSTIGNVSVKSIEVKYSLEENKADIYLEVIVNQQKVNVTELANNIAEFVESSFGYKAIVYISPIYISTYKALLIHENLFPHI